MKMKKSILISLVLPLIGCARLQRRIPTDRRDEYLGSAYCGTTYGLLVDFGPDRACPVIIQALDRYSTTNTIAVGRRTHILNAPFHYQFRDGEDIALFSQLVDRALADPSPEVRSYFMHFVTRFPKEEALRILHPMRSDPSKMVREKAEEAIDTVEGLEQNKPLQATSQ